MIKQDRSLERWNDLTKKHMAFICFLFLSVFLFCQYVLLSSYLPFFSSNCLLLDLNKKSINRKKKSKFDNKIYRWRYNGNSLFVLFWFVSHYSLTSIGPFLYVDILFIDTGDFLLNYRRNVFEVLYLKQEQNVISRRLAYFLYIYQIYFKCLEMVLF